MTAAPGPQQPDEGCSVNPSGVHYWGPYERRVVCVHCGTDSRPAAPSAQPDEDRYEGFTGNVMPPDGIDWAAEHICPSCGLRGRHGRDCPAQPVRDTGEGRR